MQAHTPNYKCLLFGGCIHVTTTPEVYIEVAELSSRSLPHVYINTLGKHPSRRSQDMAKRIQQHMSFVQGTATTIISCHTPTTTEPKIDNDSEHDMTSPRRGVEDSHLLSTQWSNSRLYAGWSAVALRLPGANTCPQKNTQSTAYARLYSAKGHQCQHGERQKRLFNSDRCPQFLV